jgi:hypothetical protein
MTAVAAIDADMRRMTRASGACRRLMTITGDGRQIRDPFACFESLVDECGRERARERVPENDRQASNLVLQGPPLANQLLARDDRRAEGVGWQ